MFVRGLTDLQKRYCELFVAAGPNVTRVQTAAEAGFEGTSEVLERTIEKLHRNTRVTAHIKELQKERASKTISSSVAVVNELWTVGSYDPADIVDDLNCVLPLKRIPEKTRRAIESITVEELFQNEVSYDPETKQRRKKKVLIGYLKKIKFAIKAAPLAILAKHFKLIHEPSEPKQLPGPAFGGNSLPPLLAALTEEKQLKLLKLIEEKTSPQSST